MKVAAIVLAAGESSRMGRPKQLLNYEGTSLVRRIVTTCLRAKVSRVIIVLGAFAGEVAEELSGLDVETVYNPGWKEGMSSSIRTGINMIKENGDQVDCALLLVADQPFISEDIINRVFEEYRSSLKSIVACEYGHTIGTPVLFERLHFSALKSLKGAEGAKKLLKQYSKEVHLVPFPLGAVDIDTLKDYHHLIGEAQESQDQKAPL